MPVLPLSPPILLTTRLLLSATRPFLPAFPPISSPTPPLAPYLNRAETQTSTLTQHMHSVDGTHPSHISLVIDDPHGPCGLEPSEHERVARIAVNGTVRLALPETDPGFPMLATLEVGGEAPSVFPSPHRSHPPDLPAHSGSSDGVYRVCGCALLRVSELVVQFPPTAPAGEPERFCTIVALLDPRTLTIELPCTDVTEWGTFSIRFEVVSSFKPSPRLCTLSTILDPRPGNMSDLNIWFEHYLIGHNRSMVHYVCKTMAVSLRGQSTCHMLESACVQAVAIDQRFNVYEWSHKGTS